MTTSTLAPTQSAAAAGVQRSHARWTVLAVLFCITVINYADRATISLAGPSITKDLDLSPVAMGYVFSAFGWAYVAAQLPGGWLLDKFGSKRVYAWSIGLWSFFTLVQGAVGFLTGLTAICGFLGGVLGGFLSDWLIKRGHSLTLARKLPIVLGMTLSMVMVACNYTDSQVLVITLMALSFFGKGMGSLGWAVNSDTAPKKIAGLSGGLLNTCGNLSSITTPIAIGYILQATGSFNGTLVYVGAHALVAALCFLVVVQKIHRVELKD